MKQFSRPLDSENEPCRVCYHCRVAFYRDRSDCHNMTKTQFFGGSVAYSEKAYQRISCRACSLGFFLTFQGVPDACEQEKEFIESATLILIWHFQSGGQKKNLLIKYMHFSKLITSKKLSNFNFNTQHH